MLRIGNKVKFVDSYDGYFIAYKDKVLTVIYSIRDDLNNGYCMVKVDGIEEEHLINSLWLERVPMEYID